MVLTNAIQDLIPYVQDIDKNKAAVIASAVALSLGYLILRRKQPSDPTPIVPYRWPVIGSSFDYFADPAKFTKENTLKYGSAFRVHLFGALITVIGADHAAEVFTHPSLSFVQSSQKYFDLPLFFSRLDNKLPEHAFRDIILKEMNQNLPRYSQNLYSQCTITAKQLLGDAREPQVIPDLEAFLRSFVARIMAHTLTSTFITEDKELMHQFEHMASEISAKLLIPGAARAMLPWWNNIYKRYAYPRNAFVKQQMKKLRDALDAEIQRRMEAIRDNKETPNDVLQYVLRVYLQDEKHAAILDTITAWLVSMTFTGVLTTSGSLIYVVLQLARHPEYAAELLEEQNEIGDKLDSAAYKRMVKLDSFIRESFRYSTDTIFHPHVNITKETVVLSNGSIIPPGGEVYINFWDLNYSQKAQREFDDLDTFKPFRYVGLDKQATKCSSEYLFFGLGRNACPGRWFAMESSKAILATILRNYELSATTSDSGSKKEDITIVSRQKL